MDYRPKFNVKEPVSYFLPMLTGHSVVIGLIVKDSNYYYLLSGVKELVPEHCIVMLKE